MKKTSVGLVFLLLIIIVCGGIYSQKFMERYQKEYYTLEDFQDIEIGKSTFRDVQMIVPMESVMVTSYGRLCEFPMQDGRQIRIKFYGPELIVGKIECTVL